AAMTADGKMLATGSSAGTVKLWDITNGDKMATLKGGNGWPDALVFTPDGKTIAAGGNGTWLYQRNYNMGYLEFWDVDSGNIRLVLQRNAKEVIGLAITPDGRTLASGSRDDTLRLWDVATGKELAVFKSDRCALKTLLFTPDSKTMLFEGYGDDEGKVILW